MFKPNLHILDRLARGAIGVSIIFFIMFNGDYLQDPIIEILLFVFGLLNLVSLATGWCPVYSIANINTRPQDNE